MVKEAAMLHDLGKIGISEKILTKKSKLVKREMEEIRKHPGIAADILRPIHVLNAVIPFILYHHERWDGKGYPTGLKGDEIPLGARIVAIADVAHYVTPGSALDREARTRGNSAYFPDRVVPMLPEALSADLCSLREGENRATLAVRMVFDA